MTANLAGARRVIRERSSWHFLTRKPHGANGVDHAKSSFVTHKTAIAVGFSVVPGNYAEAGNAAQGEHAFAKCATAWNKGKLIGAKPPLSLRHVWSIRTKLQIEGRIRELALFNLAIDSKLRGCDVVALPGRRHCSEWLCRGARDGASKKDRGRGPVRINGADPTSLDAYLKVADNKSGQFLFTNRRRPKERMTTRQYARLVSDWIAGIGLDPKVFGTHSLRRTKATLIYRRTGNLRAVQLLLGHTKIESTVRYLGIEVDDALAIAEQVEV